MPAVKKKHPRAKAAKRWSKRVTETSNAMDLESGVFKRPPKQIAASLKRSVMKSRRTKGTKYQSAMSMLNLYKNRAGKNLSAAQKTRLERAKVELRRAFGKETEPKKRSVSARAARSRRR